LARSSIALTVALALSLALGFYGLRLAQRARLANISVLAAASQLEFYRAMPAMGAAGVSMPVPSYIEIPVMQANPSMAGNVTFSIFAETPSLREASASVYPSHDSRRKKPLFLIIDTRERR
jgi:hypothetical protein